MNQPAQHHAPDAADNQASQPKSRPVYDTSASEATRELRDTSRRRRNAEEKLQQHLLEAKEHVPHHHDRAHHSAEKDHDAGAHREGKDDAGTGHTESVTGDKPQEKDPEGDASRR